jgi:predicted mannosyl-3-phosphoglycerate phosphatase (HAD superfamily)
VTYTDLDKTIPKDFEPEQVEDIIVMLNDMNIQVVSDEDIQ